MRPRDVPTGCPTSDSRRRDRMGERRVSGRKLTILVAGTIASVPRQGGWTWAVLQYLLGLRRLGHAVYFLDVLEHDSLKPTTSAASLEESENAAYFREVVDAFNLGST